MIEPGTDLHDRLLLEEREWEAERREAREPGGMIPPGTQVQANWTPQTFHPTYLIPQTTTINWDSTTTATSAGNFPIWPY